MKQIWMGIAVMALAACSGQHGAGMNDGQAPVASDMTPPLKLEVEPNRSTFIITALTSGLIVEDVAINQGDCSLFGKKDSDLRAFDPNSDEGKTTGQSAADLAQAKADVLASLPPFTLKMGEEHMLQYDACNVVAVAFKTNHGNFVWKATAN